MKTDKVLLVLSVAALASAVPLAAKPQSTDQPGRQQANIIERGPAGKASVVRTGGRDPRVCKPDAPEDGFIEPRAV